jgi:hypothetical protein
MTTWKNVGELLALRGTSKEQAMQTCINRVSVLALIVIADLGSARGQELVRRHEGPDTGGHYGASLASLADLDGDGVREYAISDVDYGYVDVRSGATGAILFSIPGTSSGTFGWSICDAGDVDGDGVSDVLVGDPYFDDPNQSGDHEGAARVFTGTDGSLIRELFGDHYRLAFGRSVATLDDVDHDGFADYLVGAGDLGFLLGGSPSYGFVRAISGSNGSTLYEVTEVGFGGAFWIMRDCIDRDGDGIRDFLAVWHDPHNVPMGVVISGHIQACSGSSGALIADLPDLSQVLSISDFDDLDGDGIGEVLTVWEDTTGPVTVVDVVSIAIGAIVRTDSFVDGGGGLNADVDRHPDCTGDGVSEYVVAGNTHALAVDGRTGATLYSFVVPTSDFLEGSRAAIRSLTDVSGDGQPEIAVGANDFAESGGLPQGETSIYTSNDLWLNADPKSVAAGVVETLVARGVPAGNLIGLAVVDVSGTPLFLFLALGPADSTEALILSDTVPSGLSGLTATFQAFAIGRTGRVVDSAAETIVFE